MIIKMINHGAVAQPGRERPGRVARATRRPRILLIVAVLVSSVLSLVGPVQAVRLSTHTADAPGPATTWVGTITADITMDSGLQVPETPNPEPNTATVEEGTCFTQFAVSGDSVMGAVTAMHFATTWPGHPQRGEAETTRMQLDQPAGNGAPGLLNSSGSPVVQITPHPLFNTVDYVIGPLAWPTAPATFDEEITGAPTDGGTPDSSPGVQTGDGGCYGGGTLEWLTTLGFAVGNGDEFSFSPNVDQSQLDPGCRQAADQPQLDLNPLAISGTAPYRGPGSAITGEAHACVVYLNSSTNRYEKAGTLLVTFSLSTGDVFPANNDTDTPTPGITPGGNGGNGGNSGGSGSGGTVTDTPTPTSTPTATAAGSATPSRSSCSLLPGSSISIESISGDPGMVAGPALRKPAGSKNTQTTGGAASFILWTGPHQLTWADYKGPLPRPNDKDYQWDAVTFSGPYARFDSSKPCQDATGKWKFILTYRSEAVAKFNPSESWVKPLAKRLSLLSHEQLHFDISEVYARQLNAELLKLLGPNKTFAVPCQSKQDCEKKIKRKILPPQIKSVADQNELARRQQQCIYDYETEHGVRKQQQKEWEQRVAYWLKNNNSSSAPGRMSKSLLPPTCPDKL